MSKPQFLNLRLMPYLVVGGHISSMSLVTGTSTFSLTFFFAFNIYVTNLKFYTFTEYSICSKMFSFNKVFENMTV